MITPPVYHALNQISDVLDALDSSLAEIPVHVPLAVAHVHRKRALDRIRRILDEIKTVKPEMP